MALPWFSGAEAFPSMEAPVSEAFNVPDDSAALYTDKLRALLSRCMPHYELPDPAVEVSFDDSTGDMAYTATVHVLGQLFQARGDFVKANDAVEASARVAHDVIDDLFRVLLTEEQDQAHQQLFQPLLQEIQGFGQSASASTISSLKGTDSLSTHLKAGAEALTCRLNELESAKADEASKAKAVRIAATFAKVHVRGGGSSVLKAPAETAKETKAAPEPKTIIATLPADGDGYRSSFLTDPVTALHEYVDKQPGPRHPVIFEDYYRIASSTQYYGCRLIHGGKWWAVGAEFAKKKEAHMTAALMACTELLGPGFRYEGVEPETHADWTRASVRASCDRFSFGYTSDLLQQGQADIGTSPALPSHLAALGAPVSATANERSKAPAKTETPTTTLPELPEAPDGRKYSSLLNEVCQKLRITLPNFHTVPVSSMSNYFVCTVQGFMDLPLMESAAFTRKMDARDDVAGRIYLILQERGLISQMERNFVPARIKKLRAELASSQSSPNSNHGHSNSTHKANDHNRGPSPKSHSAVPMHPGVPSFPGASSFPGVPSFSGASSFPGVPMHPSFTLPPGLPQFDANAPLPDPGTFMQMMQQWQAGMMSMYYSAFAAQQQRMAGNDNQRDELNGERRSRRDRSSPSGRSRRDRSPRDRSSRSRSPRSYSSRRGPSRRYSSRSRSPSRSSSSRHNR
jgi:hypothetical protein